MSDVIDDDDDEPVGYGKPPREHQWKPGQSGNPNGRRKGARSIKEIIDAALRARVKAKIDGKHRTVSKLELIAMAQVNKAAAGDPKATKLVMDHLAAAADEIEDEFEVFLDMGDKVLRPTSHCAGTGHDSDYTQEECPVEEPEEPGTGDVSRCPPYPWPNEENAAPKIEEPVKRPISRHPLHPPKGNMPDKLD
jgi:hypothetical protein